MSLKDRKNASTVCRFWYEASIHPTFLCNEVVCLKDMDDKEIKKVMKVYSISVRSLFAFKFCGLGISFLENENDDAGCSVDENHWAKTYWPLIGSKVFSLEFFDTVEFVDGILPAILNVTKNLRELKIHNLQYSPNEELFKVKRLQSLKVLKLDNLQTENIDNDKLLGVIPKGLNKLCLKSMWGSKFIIKDITKVISHCSLYLEDLELIDIDVSSELMQSIANLDMKLKIFCLVLASSMHYDHEPEIMWPLFKTQWPLIRLALHGDCLTYRFLRAITETFHDLEGFTVSSDFVNPLIESEDKCISLSQNLKKLTGFFIGFGEEFRYGVFFFSKQCHSQRELKFQQRRS